MPTNVQEPEAVSASISINPPLPPDAGGSRELLKLALPLILSQSFMTIQVFVDRLLLSWHDPKAMAASFPAVMWFWLFFGILQVTAGYVSTFVAQYTGANRSHRVGPAVWQGIHFAIVAGLLLLVVVPIAPWLMGLSGHEQILQDLGTIYLRCLSFAALPMLLIAACNGFFSGRGQTWTILGIEAVGTFVNVCLSVLLIFDRPGFSGLGILGAGLGTIAGSAASAVTALFLLLRPRYRQEFNTLRGWRLDRPLLWRLLKYGGPAGTQVFLEVVVFLVFVMLVGRLGVAATGATALTVLFNMVTFLPMMGIGQAISILVGQRLGANRPDIAEKSAYSGLRWIFAYTCVVAAVYLLLPRLLVSAFDSTSDPETSRAVAEIVPGLLACVAVYSLAEAVNLSFAFALRGAGDTRFVSLLSFALGWPIMVVPTYLVVTFGGNVYWAWGFATAYIMAMALCFFLRFRSGKWKTMRVIEAPVDLADEAKQD
jgi:MATE family multidrug resistance protein